MAWLYLKLCHDPGVDCEVTDGILVQHVRSNVDGLRATGLADLVFFLRYVDHDGFHIRLRVHSGDRRRTMMTLWPNLQFALERISGSRLCVAPYEPETDKYGGPHGIRIAEEHFSASSDLALTCIKQTQGHMSRRLLIAAELMRSLLLEIDEDLSVQRELLRAYASYWNRYLDLDISPSGILGSGKSAWWPRWAPRVD
jgi:thiopeptide-type bacteriocin biosynthesis protein